MSVEENKSIILRLVEECWNKRNYTVLDEIVAADCRHHMNGPVNLTGPVEFKRAVQMWIKALPDLTLTPGYLVAEGDMVAGTATIKGTHNGELKFPAMPAAIPPTGKTLELEIASISRIANGKIAETWDILDSSWIQRLAQS